MCSTGSLLHVNANPLCMSLALVAVCRTSYISALILHQYIPPGPPLASPTLHPKTSVRRSLLSAKPFLPPLLRVN
jgi:hypothetical protein